jgi:diguanylate cyclase (GGDEF)-like protein
MSFRAWAYIWCVLIAGAVLSIGALISVGQPGPDTWLTFAVLTGLATFTRLFKAMFQSQSHPDTGALSYSPILVFLFAGILLLPPFLFALMVGIAYTVEWIKERWQKTPFLRAWYIQPFNVAAHLLAGAATSWIYNTLEVNTAPVLSPLPVFVVFVAACVYVFLNHLLVGQALVLGRGVSWQKTGVLGLESLIPDFIMVLVGYALAILWSLNPWMILPVLAPLVLIYQAIKVPQLKKDAQIDGKTGLLNASHFNKGFVAELERAAQTHRPLALIMADLDLLRNVNNTYGHLAGDTVLAGIGQILRDSVRVYDIAGRFGGEEFALVLPETNRDEAVAFAEQLRLAVAAAQFSVISSADPISVTISVGIACFPDQGQTVTALTHEADVAVYQAKLKGRNCVVCAADVPRFTKLEKPGEGQQAVQYPAAFMQRLPPPEPTEKADLPPSTPGVAAGATRARREAAAVISALLAQRSQPAAVATEPHDPNRTRPPMARHVRLFVAVVSVVGIVTALLGVAFSPLPHPLLVGLLVVLAMTCEWLQIDVYGDNTASVTIAVLFAAAVTTGVPGVAVASAAVALIHYLRQRRRGLSPMVFNWANHVIAGAAVVLVMQVVGLPLELANLLPLLVPASAAALIAYFIETGMVAGAIALSTQTSLVRTWRAQFAWLAGHYLVLCLLGLFLGLAYSGFGVVGVGVFTLPVLMMRYAQKQYVDQTRGSMQELKRLNHELAQANQEISSASQSIQQLNAELFQTLATILDSRDPYVGGHAVQVSRYATRIAQEMHLPPERVEWVRQAGCLHDIGKISIPEQLLHKPSKLTPEEYEHLKTHAALGGEFLEPSKALCHLAGFVRSHHERWDGTGYPDQLRGEEIPLEARILAVCDAVEAMASDRPYQQAKSVSEIIAEVKRCAGTQFDPTVVAVFVRLAEAEGEAFIVNSAREVMRRQMGPRTADTPFGWVRAPLGTVLLGQPQGRLLP